MKPDLHIISESIKTEALRLGFTDCGFSKAEAIPEDAQRLREWLNNGYHAGMLYMENHFEKRTDPTKLEEGAKTVISVLLNYYTDRIQSDPEAPILSKYAYGTDYHFVMKDRLKELYNYIDTKFGPVSGRVFVDSAPVMDRAWARKAGLGWIGKNSNLISRSAGSFVFIGEIVIDLELKYNTSPESDFCGSCSLCIDACPTNAILPGRTLDAQKCISYQTIENKEPIDEKIRPALSNRMFGCDICQDVCPWNRKALIHTIPELNPSEELMQMSKSDWAALEKSEHKRLFKSSALKRARFEKLKGNIESIL